VAPMEEGPTTRDLRSSSSTMAMLHTCMRMEGALR
jgi:hypothetical protein